MFYNSAYIVAENNDFGFECKEEYMHVNSVGYLELNHKWSSTHRKIGRVDYLIMYIYSGKMKVRLNSNDIVIKEGNVILYRPGQEQLYRHDMEHPVKVYWTHFTGHGAEQLLNSLELGEGNILNIGISDEIPSLIKMMINDIQTKNIGYKTVSASLLMQLLTVISRKSLRNSFRGTKKSIYDFNTSLNYINMNYMKNIHVSKLSEIASLCTNRYIKVFKMEFGTTPKAYIVGLRLKKACELLDITNLSIKQICLMVGIENQLYFSRLFKNHIGTSPSEYRRQKYIP